MFHKPHILRAQEIITGKTSLQGTGLFGGHLVSLKLQREQLAGKERLPESVPDGTPPPKGSPDPLFSHPSDFLKCASGYKSSWDHMVFFKAAFFGGVDGHWWVWSGPGVWGGVGVLPRGTGASPPSESPHLTQTQTFQPAASDLGVKAVQDPSNMESRALVC